MGELNDLNITQLKYFLAVTEHDTFLEAADEMNISQSSLSKQLGRLEDELGVQLFDRSKRSSSLTEAGKVFLKEAGRLLNQYQIMLSHMKIYKKNNGTFRIGSLAFLGQYGLNFKIAEFTASHPEYSITVEDVEEDILLEGFKDGSYDLIIGRTLPPEIFCEYSEKIADDELIVVVKADDVLIIVVGGAEDDIAVVCAVHKKRNFRHASQPIIFFHAKKFIAFPHQRRI